MTLPIGPGTPSSARPTSGYLLSLSLGCVGLACLGFSLGGEMVARAGRHTFDAIDRYGFPAFMLSFAVIFASRIIFWTRASTTLRSVVRTMLAAILLVALVASVPALILAWMPPPQSAGASMPQFFGVLGALAQVGSIIWLLRYRAEPDC